MLTWPLKSDKTLFKKFLKKFIIIIYIYLNNRSEYHYKYYENKQKILDAALLTIYGEQKWRSQIWLRRKRKLKLNVEPYNLQIEVQNNTPPPPNNKNPHAYWTQYAWILIWKNRYFVANNGITLIYAYYCTKEFPRAYSNIHLMYRIVAEMANDMKNKRLPSWPLPLQSPITIKPASLNHQLQ